jgi:hypothetical protein
MTLANLHGFTCLNKNLRCFIYSKSFKPLLSVCLSERFLLSKPTRVVSTKNKFLLPTSWYFTPFFLCVCSTTEWVCRKENCHIVEVGLSLFAHANMLLKYWDEGFLETTYLINRLPIKILEFSSPLELLFNEKPNYSGLSTFGCACWPNLKPFNTHKLQFYSKQCVFLGYINMHKGFKCIDVAGGRAYISRDIFVWDR